jgi:hypothetical protein
VSWLVSVVLSLFLLTGLPSVITSKGSEAWSGLLFNFLVRLLPPPPPPSSSAEAPYYPRRQTNRTTIPPSFSSVTPTFPPAYIADTGIATQRDAIKDKEKEQSLKQKTRERVQPKMGKIDIDYQKLHDAFFRFQTKPKMTSFGEV